MSTTGEESSTHWWMPWLPPPAFALDCLAALPEPPQAVQLTDPAFDYDPATDDLESRFSKPWALDITSAGRRRTWRLSRIWLPGPDDGPADILAYLEAERDVQDLRFPPACLDYYAEQVGNAVQTIRTTLHEKDMLTRPPLKHWTPQAIDLWEQGNSWGSAGVAVLQSALPYPFTGILDYSLDNRPAHRLLYHYASLLAMRHPRKAYRWYRALIFMNPYDDIGVRSDVRSAQRWLAPGVMA